MDSHDILYIIALTDARGADNALAEAIERGLISPDQHSDSEDYIEAEREVEGF